MKPKELIDAHSVDVDCYRFLLFLSKQNPLFVPDLLAHLLFLNNLFVFSALVISQSNI